MRALRLLALAAALVAPAAAHAQIRVYVGPSPRYIAPACHRAWVQPGYGYGYAPAIGYIVPARPGWGYDNGWRAHRYWAEHGYYRRGWGHDRRW